MVGAYPLLSEAQFAINDGRLEDAARLLMNHVRQHPEDPRGLSMLGSVAVGSGALMQGEMFLRQALARAPHQPEVLLNLASCLQQQERLDEALPLFDQLRRSGDPGLEILYIRMLERLERPDEARALLEPFVQRHPERPEGWLALGHNLRFAGRVNEAVAAYRRAIAIQADLGDAWWGLASIKQRVFTDEDIAAMRSAIAVAVDPNNLAPLHFSIARALHDRQHHADAFGHYAEANRIRAESLNYNPEQLSEEVKDTERLFTSAFFAQTPAAGDPSQAPIFIVSLPRSGSTLLEQMIGSHPDVEALGELPYIPALLRSMMEAATRAGIRSVTDAIARLSPADRTAMGREYLRRASLGRKTDAPRFVDKLPHNWSNALFIRQILPNAKIVDIRRDAMTCCWSNFSHSFSRAHSSSFTLEGIGRAYCDYVRFMAHLDREAPGWIHHVRYEDLVEEPEPKLRGIFDHLGLPWDETVLRFHESERNVRTPSAEQVRRPLNREGMGTWRPYAEWLGPLREALGPLATQ